MNHTTTNPFLLHDTHVVCLSISYQGDAFKGIQRQEEVRTVAGILERALADMVFHPVKLLMAGRTDAGVHATRQVVSFVTSVHRPKSAYLEGVNNKLPCELRINHVSFLSQDFHPRFLACSRRYVYLMHRDRYLPAQWMKRAYAVGRDLDVSLMQHASQFLVGTHDFTSFRASGCQAFSPIRTVLDIQFYEKGSWVMMSIEANAFLYRMVRKIMQSLVHVGTGLWDKEAPGEILNAKNNLLVLPLKPDGLYLTDIVYPCEYVEANRSQLCWLEEWMRGV